MIDYQDDYESLRDVIIGELNPPDDDIAEPAIMMEAVERAAEFIRSQPCTCIPLEEACPRCNAIGRLSNVVLER